MTLCGGFGIIAALAMNGFTSRAILFSLASSVAFSLAPQAVAQESGGDSVASVEKSRRQLAAREAIQKVQEARTAYSEGRYSEAVDAYREALATMPHAPATEKQVKFIKDSLADALVAKGMDYRKVGRVDEAVEFMKEALELSPGHKFAKKELVKTQDPVRTNPALTPQHVGNVEEVNRLLTLAFGYYDLGNFDKAQEAFDSVLKIDAYNSAARRGLELVHNRRQSYFKSAHDSFRAKALSEVDQKWDEPLPLEATVGALSATEAGTVIKDDSETEARIAEALKQMMLSQVVFEDASAQDVIEELRRRIRHFEAKGITPGRSINVEGNFGPADTEVYKSVMARRVNLNLTNISVFDLLNMLDSQLGTTHFITSLGIEITFSDRNFGPIQERTYLVPPHFFDSKEDDGDEEDDDFASSRVRVKRVNPVTALKEMGISFPEGARASYDAASRRLVVRNTAFNHREIEELISMPIESDRAVVLNVIAMEIDEDDLNELGFEWLFNFNIGPKALFGSGTVKEKMSSLVPAPTFMPQVTMPQDGYLATEGLRSGKLALSADNIENLISVGRAGAFNATDGTRRKAPGILSFRGIWDAGDVTMIMRGAAQKKGTDILSNPRIVFTPGRDEQVVFANVKEMFYPDTYAEPSFQATSFNLPGTTRNSEGKKVRKQGRSAIATPAHPESFVRFGMVDENVGGVGSVVQVHDASVAPDGQHVTMALTVTINEFEGFINWGSPINALLMTQEGTNSMAMELSENLILKPIFKRKMENTKVTVGSGSVVVIGGLKEARSVKFEDKLPVLGDLPMVGRLFRSAGENKVRKALLMFVKVDIVDPTGRTLGTGERPSDVTN